MLGELNRAEIEQILRTQIVGRLGCHAGGQTYVVPVAYVLDGQNAVYFHTLEGLKVRMMRANPDVCFEVDVVEDLGSWQSVIGWGRVEELTGEAATDGLERLMARLLPFTTGETTTPSHRLPSSPGLGKLRNQLIICRLNLTQLTGRFEKRSQLSRPPHPAGVPIL